MTDPTQETEIRILAVIRRKKNYYKYKPILQAAFFNAEVTKQLFNLIDFFFTKYQDNKLTTGSLKMLVNKKIKDKDLKSESKQVIKKIRKLSSKDNEVTEETIKDFVKRQIVKQGILEGLELLDTDSPDFTTLRDKIDSAINLSSEKEEEFYDYFKEPEQRVLAEAQEKRVSTCIRKLDEALAGGIAPGELGVFMGPPGRGKTLCLINMGVAGLIQGLKVLHITLEISARKVARRYDERICGRSFEGYQNNAHRLKRPLKRLHKKGCNLIIKDYSMREPTTEDIRSYMINHQNKHKQKFDLLIIDYGDLIRSKRKYKDVYHEYDHVYREIRRLGVEFQIPVYTASQTTRKSLSKYVITMEDVAESFAKVKVADIVIAICQTQEEQEESLARLYIAKARRKHQHPSIRLNFNTDKALIGETDEREINSEFIRNTD